MNPKQRIVAIRLAEKVKKNPKYANEIGITADLKIKKRSK